MLALPEHLLAKSDSVLTLYLVANSWVTANAFSSAACAGSPKDRLTAPPSVLRATSLVVSSAADTLLSAATRSGFAALVLSAGMMLSVFCRCWSSSRTTSLVPATGAQPPAAALLAGAAVPEDPALPQPAIRPT